MRTPSQGRGQLLRPRGGVRALAAPHALARKHTATNTHSLCTRALITGGDTSTHGAGLAARGSKLLRAARTLASLASMQTSSAALPTSQARHRRPRHPAPLTTHAHKHWEAGHRPAGLLPRPRRTPDCPRPVLPMLPAARLTKTNAATHQSRAARACTIHTYGSRPCTHTPHHTPPPCHTLCWTETL